MIKPIVPPDVYRGNSSQNWILTYGNSEDMWSQLNKKLQF